MPLAPQSKKVYRANDLILALPLISHYWAIIENDTNADENADNEPVICQESAMNERVIFTADGISPMMPVVSHD